MQEEENEKASKAEKIFAIIMVVAVSSFVVFFITLLIMYHGKPMNEIPEWIKNIIYRR